MKRFNMKTLSLISSLSSLALLMACGDNVTDNDPVTTQAYASQEEFPECEESSEGYFALVSSTNDLYICSAKEWVNISKTGSSAKPGCSSEELEDGTGVKIICNGDSVATLNYGKQGATGSKGEDGHKGKTGEKGEPGSSTNGKDAVWDTDRCKLKNTGSDVMVFDCGDSVYVSSLDISGGNTNNVWKPWPNFKLEYFVGANTLVIFNKPTNSEAKGTLERYDGDNSWVSGGLTLNDLFRDEFQVKGTATVELAKAEAVSASYYRPSVGLAFGVPTSKKNLGPNLGLCLTYSSEKDMALLVRGETGFIKASVPATKNKIKIINVPWESFEPVVKEVDAEKVIKAANLIFVEAVGGEAAGTYTNKFSIFQVGDFGNCNDMTYSKWEAYIKEISTPLTTTVTDRYNSSIKYNAVTIGNQTWLTGNMRGATESKGFCLDESDSFTLNCPNSGKVYTWLESLGSYATNYECTASATCTYALPTKVQGICPTGYHIPNTADWNTLFNTIAESVGKSDILGAVNRFILTMALFEVGGNINSTNNNEQYAKNLTGLGLHLTSRSGWVGRYWSSGEAQASYGNAILFTEESSPTTNSSYNYLPYLTASQISGTLSKTSRYPVRCVKD